MEAYRRALERNIPKLYWLDFFRGSIIFIPIIVPFMQENGLSLQQVFWLESMFTLTLVLLEIPSGYASDRWGRKNTTIVAASISLFGILFYAIGDSITYFLIGDILLGIGLSFYSGTIEALTYDTLLELDRTDDYKRVAGNVAFFHFGSEAILSVVAGFLAVISLRLPVALTLIPFALAFCTALTLTEPKRHRIQEKRHVHAMWNIAKKTMLHNAPLRCIIVLHSVISTMTISLFWFTQPYQTSVGLPLAFFGLAHGVIVAAGAISSKMTHQAEQYADDRILMMLIGVMVIAAYIALGFVHAMWGLVFFLLCRIAWGVLSPLTSDIINRMTDSSVRATVLSIRAFFFRGMFTIVAPFLGYMADVLTINQAILMTGIIGGILILITFLTMHSVWNKIPK